MVITDFVSADSSEEALKMARKGAKGTKYIVKKVSYIGIVRRMRTYKVHYKLRK